MPRVEIEFVRLRRVEEGILLEVDITKEELEAYENGDLDLWELYHREEVRTNYAVDSEWMNLGEEVEEDVAEVIGEVY